MGELVEWTHLVARGEPLPTREEDRRPFKEFRALREALRSMETELGRARAREVEAAEVRAWSDVARRVAHELKNPLTPIRMGAGSLMRSEEASVRETGEMIQEEVQRLDRMARDFSRFGRPPEGPAAPVDVGELLATLVKRHSGEAGTAPVRLDLQAPLPFVDGHHDALGRAVLNLLVNAQEALGDQSGGRVEVVARPAPGGLEVLVRENGPGIPPEIRDDVWRPDITTRSRGSGLGLAMVRQTVLAHRGEVELADAPGGGAEFRIFLPADPTPAPGAAEG